jgi:hypothetical protein
VSVIEIVFSCLLSGVRCPMRRSMNSGTITISGAPPFETPSKVAFEGSISTGAAVKVPSALMLTLGADCASAGLRTSAEKPYVTLACIDASAQSFNQRRGTPCWSVSHRPTRRTGPSQKRLSPPPPPVAERRDAAPGFTTAPRSPAIVTVDALAPRSTAEDSNENVSMLRAPRSGLLWETAREVNAGGAASVSSSAARTKTDIKQYEFRRNPRLVASLYLLHRFGLCPA